MGGGGGGSHLIFDFICSSVTNWSHFLHWVKSMVNGWGWGGDGEGGDIPRVQTWSRLPGTVWRGLIFFTTDRPHYHRMPPLSGDNHGWVVSAVRTGCALGHRATTIRACAHLMKTAARYQLRAQGRSFVPGPNKFGGITGRSPGERPHYGIAGESPGKRDLMWTQGEREECGVVFGRNHMVPIMSKGIVLK